LIKLDEATMQGLKRPSYQDRSKINMNEAREINCWAKHLGVSKEQLQKAVEKVGNGAAAVKKELADLQCGLSAGAVYRRS
jgi:hypothetical protein